MLPRCIRDGGMIDFMGSQFEWESLCGVCGGMSRIPSPTGNVQR